MTSKPPVKYIETKRAVGIPERGPDPCPVSAKLMALYDELLRPHPDIPMPATVSAEIHDEAQRVLDYFKPWAQPVGDVVLRDWLEPVIHAVRQTQPRTDFQYRQWSNAVCLACRTLPKASFTLESQGEFLRSQTFLPSAADVAQSVSYRTNRINERIRILGLIIRTPVEGEKQDRLARL